MSSQFQVKHMLMQLKCPIQSQCFVDPLCMLASNPLAVLYNEASRACSGGSVCFFGTTVYLKELLLMLWKTSLFALNVPPRPSAYLARQLFSPISDGVIITGRQHVLVQKLLAKHLLMYFIHCLSSASGGTLPTSWF